MINILKIIIRKITISSKPCENGKEFLHLYFVCHPTKITKFRDVSWRYCLLRLPDGVQPYFLPSGNTV